MLALAKRRAAALTATALAVAGCVTAAEVAPKAPPVQTVEILAQRFNFTPDEIKVKKGMPVDLELTTLDRLHGFDVPGLGLRAQIVPGETTHVKFMPDKAGRFLFHCDIFCGEGHEDMDAAIVVEE
ncbi:MAG TPA: cupredoxin domain-containing protein [Stellaceae bacterium]|jgi:cytochrome c oxidase subunit 2|nr:cupredoxin domain-containing protein [Stellaceae bacterium]